MTRRLLLPLWFLIALAGWAGACRDPNPTFVFDAAASDGAREGGATGADGAVTDGGGQ
jgi:hypothetical protein